ncbi:uncharacterized protein J4E84_008751 [Alternaria hordeiaustralica]|uniref:uncharacterized protein n=1 Tax=Alternaria hordeiaustralica TaxID=1187925 RepID=UPI0020C2384E|nr:uncharacterized protein J4E84_008751 [Alternaria hordeiaustralica]KAI4678495.1 hypothetical protein J4E84_008751 [Alternaria hordeiaustralica]
MANNYAHPPPMQQLPGIPGINLAPYAQNGQQPPFPAFPPPDANLWALFQSGSFPPGAPNLPPPPPFPNMAFPPPSLPPQPPLPERVQEVTDSDREDGELSEGDSSPSLMDKLQQDRDAAKQFIKLLHSNNVSYKALANEQLDPELLRGLYQSANLPSEPAPILPPKINDAVSKAPAVQPVTPVAQDAPKSVASPSTPGHRQDYIARLQAAKAAKQAAAAKPTTPAPVTKTPQPATPPAAKPPVTDEQRARNTELIRQRLEAIKARQKPPVTPGSHTPTSAAYTPSFSAIPGLFMGASSTSNTPAPAAPQPASLPNASTPHTRPLGQSPHADQEDDSMIIDVSEDESNGSDMDIDDDQPAPQAGQHSRQAPGTLPNFHSGAMPATPSAAAVGTSGAETPNTVAREKELVDKEKQLVAMRETLKKKLAEKRERDRLAAAASAATSPSTSQKTSTPVPSLQASTPASLPTSTTQFVSFPSHSKDTNRLRRAEIQSKLPTLDAEIASNASRMAQLTKELEQLTAQNERIARDKEQLTKELEDLGVDTEGMSHAQLRAKKDEIEGEQSSDSNSPSNQTQPASQPAVKDASPISLSDSTQQTSVPMALPGLGQNTVEPEQESYEPPELPEQVMPVEGAINPAASQIHSGPQDSPANGIRTLNPSAPAFVSAAQQNQIEDTHSVSPRADASVQNAIDVAKANASAAVDQEIQQPITAPSPSEEGEVDMSVSEGDEDEEEEEEYEPEYEPEESVVIPEVPVEEEVEVQTKPEYSLESSQASLQEEEAYEPPDVEEDMPDVQVGEESTADQYEPTAQAEAGDGAMDIATSSDDSSDDSESDDESTPEPEMGKSISAYNPLHQDAGIADDLAPELQPEVTSSAATGGPVPEVSEQDEEPEPARFTPYESPLRMFKSYRYHPNYAQDINGGFLSLTFSHQINPEKPLCQYELAGGACNDPECPDQHFREVAITGDKLLVQLGTANPGKTSEEKQRWNDGLRGVLKELRQKNIKDPNGIAVEIARYRRQFLNDDTRVVNL